MVKITLEYETLEEARMALLSLIVPVEDGTLSSLEGEPVGVTDEAETEKPATKKRTTKKKTAKKAKAEPEEKEIKIEDVRAALTKVGKEFGLGSVKEICQANGGTSLRDLKPDVYENVIKACDAKMDDPLA